MFVMNIGKIVSGIVRKDLIRKFQREEEKMIDLMMSGVIDNGLTTSVVTGGCLFDNTDLDKVMGLVCNCKKCRIT